METPLVTIGLLTYNHEKYIASALEGILSQKYQPIELIILDDASNDRTPLIIEQYMDRMKDKLARVVSLKNETNSGNIPRNCNRMIMESSGIFYYGISGDDILLSQAVELLCTTLQNHSECNVIHANMIQVQDTFVFGERIDVDNVILRGKDSGLESKNLFQQLMYSNCIAAPTVMLRREVFERHGYHDESIAFEDYEYWLRISQSEKFYFLNAPVILYRRAETSVTNFEIKSNFGRLKTAIDSDYFTKKKYIKQLKKNEQIKCWQAYFSFYYQLCSQSQYQEGLNSLEIRRKELGIALDDYQKDFRNRQIRLSKEKEILRLWSKIDNIPDILGSYMRKQQMNTIAIYGYSQLGRVLHQKLSDEGIHVEYIIDQKGEMLGCQLPVYTLENVLPQVDVIIIAPVGLYEIIKPQISKKTNAKIMDLEKMVEDLMGFKTMEN